MKKRKKRPRAALPPPQQPGATGTSAEEERKVRTSSMKRKKADQLSPEMLEDALDTAMYANVASLPQPYEMRMPNKPPPPPYEDCVKSAASTPSLRGTGMEATWGAQPPFDPRQKSMPAAVGVSPESYLQHMPQQGPPQSTPRQHNLSHSQQN